MPRATLLRFARDSFKKTRSASYTAPYGYRRNLPESYVEHAMAPGKFKFRGHYMHRDWYRYTQHGPWSPQEETANAMHTRKDGTFRPRSHLYLEPLREWHIFVGDKVKIQRKL